MRTEIPPGPVGRAAPLRGHVGPACPHRVVRASMDHRWDHLTFLHWAVEPSVVQRLLPPGLEVETWDGTAWVGLVPFLMTVTPPGRGPAPWLSRFPETNVRTYVRAPDGTTGVWFLSLDASRLPAVGTARSTWSLPYFWSQMAVTTTGPVVSYRSRRRWPGPVGARSQVAVEVGPAYEPDELGDLDHWLTARYRLYFQGRRKLGHALAEHDPWPLRRARALHVDTGLLVAAGLPAPSTPPIVHWSPGVAVRVGFPHRSAPPNPGAPATT